MRYELRPARHQDPACARAFHALRSPHGSPWVSFHRNGGDYLIRFLGLADFEIAADGLEVRCWPVPGVTESTVEHLYSSQVLPLALSRQGRLVLHGSAVEMKGGALAFLGRSGRGKSTLAASFAVAGHRLLTDDRLEVAVDEQVILAWPSDPSIRLWDDSREVLIGSDVPAAAPVQFSPKARFLAGGSLVFCPEPLPLHGLYFLGDGAVDAPSIRPVSGREAWVELARNAFLLDIEGRDVISAHVDRLSRMARMPIFYRLDYPRRFDALVSVRRAILDHSRGRREGLVSDGSFEG